MEVYLLFAQRVEATPGQYAPQVLGAIDAHTLNEISMLEVETEIIDDWNLRFSDDIGHFDENYSNTTWIKTILNQPVAYFRDRLIPVVEVAGVVEELVQPKGDRAAYGGITVTRGRQGGQIIDDEIIG